MKASPPAADRRRRVADHYDELSPYYRELWGEHIHHGYYERGDESRREATENLVARVVEPLRLRAGARVVDVGCGLGGTARLLAQRPGCDVVGVTLSPVQARMATDASSGTASLEVPRPAFVVGDAAALPIAGSFDAVIAVEVLSHVADRSAFFREAARLLRPGARLGIAAWLKAAPPEGRGSEADSSAARYDELIERIERGMLVTLPTARQYEELAEAAGFELVAFDDISDRVAKTWELCIDIVARPRLWGLAAQKGRDVLAFVRSFGDMRRGFESGAFRYAVIIAEKR